LFQDSQPVIQRSAMPNHRAKILQNHPILCRVNGECCRRLLVDEAAA
jgi:hypothetical protein